MSKLDVSNVPVEQMMQYVARFKSLRGSQEAYVDSRLPGHRRRKINIVGMGVVERAADPDLAPNIPLPAHGFNLGMIQAEPGNGAALHAHKTEEIFMPLIGNWAVVWMTKEGEKEIELEPYDCVHVPVGVYRGFRYLGPQPVGTLLTIIGGPDAGKVEWLPSVLEAAEKSGLARDAKGELVAK